MTAKPVSISGKVVLITGASAGIGRASAHAFAARGARVVLASRNGDQLKEVESELRCYGVQTLVVPTDISDDDALQDLVSRTRATFGRVDVLVNNAGICRGGMLCEMDPEELSEMLQVNLHGTFRLTQMMLPLMFEQKFGHIVNVSSFAARFYLPGVSVYSATKAAILVFSNTLRREVQGRGVFVSTILGGPARTGMISGAVEAALRHNGWDRSRFLNRLSQSFDGPEVVARAILRAVLRRKREVRTGGPVFYALASLDAFAPGLLDYVLSRVDPSLVSTVTQELGNEEIPSFS